MPFLKPLFCSAFSNFRRAKMQENFYKYLVSSSAPKSLCRRSNNFSGVKETMRFLSRQQQKDRE
jgi:hypothetical protein